MHRYWNDEWIKCHGSSYRRIISNHEGNKRAETHVEKRGNDVDPYKCIVNNQQIIKYNFIRTIPRVEPSGINMDAQKEGSE